MDPTVGDWQACVFLVAGEWLNSNRRTALPKWESNLEAFSEDKCLVNGGITLYVVAQQTLEIKIFEWTSLDHFVEWSLVWCGENGSKFEFSLRKCSLFKLKTSFVLFASTSCRITLIYQFLLLKIPESFKIGKGIEVLAMGWTCWF